MIADNIIVILNSYHEGVESIEPSAEALFSKYQNKARKSARLISLDPSEVPQNSCSQQWKSLLEANHREDIDFIQSLADSESLGIYVSSHGYMRPEPENPYLLGATPPSQFAELIAALGFTKKRIDKISFVACNMRGESTEKFCKSLYDHTTATPLVASYIGYVTVMRANKEVFRTDNNPATLHQKRIYTKKVAAGTQKGKLTNRSEHRKIAPQSYEPATGKKLVKDKAVDKYTLISALPVPEEELREINEMPENKRSQVVSAEPDVAYSQQLRDNVKHIYQYDTTSNAVIRRTLNDWASKT